MATLIEGQHTGEFLVSEANNYRSRETVTLTGVNGKAGLVLGKITASGLYTEYDDTKSDGTQNAAGVLFDNVDASNADQSAVIIARDAEVNQSQLQYKSTQTATHKTNAEVDLKAIGVIVRS